MKQTYLTYIPTKRFIALKSNKKNYRIIDKKNILKIKLKIKNKNKKPKTKIKTKTKNKARKPESRNKSCLEGIEG